jgi:hypothetical protein
MMMMLWTEAFKWDLDCFLCQGQTTDFKLVGGGGGGGQAGRDA